MRAVWDRSQTALSILWVRASSWGSEAGSREGRRTLRMTNLQVGPSPLMSLPMDARAAAGVPIVVRGLRLGRGFDVPLTAAAGSKKWQSGGEEEGCGSARQSPVDVWAG